MYEPLTTQLLAELLGDLSVAFPTRKSDVNLAQLATVYRNGLNGLSGDSVREAVRRSIQTDQYFPKVARLREHAMSYDRQRTVSVAIDRGEDPDRCRICGARAERWEIQQPTGELDEKGRPLMHTVLSTGVRMTHDARAHGIRQAQEDAA